MKISRILALVAVLVLTFAMPASAADDNGRWPTRGTVTGAHWLDPFPPPEELTQFDGCTKPALWKFHSSGSGRMWHLGKVDYDLVHCTYPDAAGVAFGDGTITFTDRWGATLVIAQTGTSAVIGGPPPADPLGFTGNGTWVVVGGTGRFAHATGSGSMTFVGDVPGDANYEFGLDGHAQFKFKGKISYNFQFKKLAKLFGKIS